MADDTSPRKKPKYSHIDGDNNFQERSTAVFGCLDNLEPAKERNPPKKPGRRLPHRVPDHVVHPEKWTKYSLEEDGTSSYQGVSGDVANRNIALSFLDDLRKRRSSETKGETTSNEPIVRDDNRKIVFSKDAVLKSKAEMDVTKAVELSAESQSRVKGRVNVMPEYVVGQTPKKCSKARVAKCSDAGSAAADKTELDVGLEHLQEQDQPTESCMQAEQQQDEMAGDKVTFAKRKNRGRKAIRKRGAEEELDNGNSTAKE